ncbi:hypothetical protein HDU93_005525, partial [Gonapodya sp. JEL0774]
MSDIEALQKQLAEATQKAAELEAANKKLAAQIASKTAAPIAGSISFKEPTPSKVPSPAPAAPAAESRTSTSEPTPLGRRNSVMTVVASYHGPGGDAAEDDEDTERVVVVIPSNSVTIKGMDPFAHGALDLAVKSLVRDGDKLTVLVLSESESIVDGIIKLTTTSDDAPRSERQAVNYVKAIAQKIYNWYPKD